MFDLGWTELMVIGIVALIVVGPKDLPKMFRSIGQFTAKARAMAREFQRAMDEAADASGVKDVARDLRKATDAKSMGLDKIDEMRKWDPLKDEDNQADPAVDKKPPARRSADASMSEDEAAGKARIKAEMDKLRQERATGASEAQTAPAQNVDQNERGADKSNL